MIKKTHNFIYQLSKKWGKKFGLDLPYFIKNGFWVFVRQFVEVIAGVSLSVIFARLASQEIYGQYQFILSIFTTISILSIPGLNTSIIKSVAEGKDGEYQSAVRTSFYWSFSGVPILFLIGSYYYLVGSHPLGIALMLASIFFPFFYAPNTWYSFLQGKKRFDVLARFGAIQALANAIATIIVIFFYRDNLIIITLTYLISYTFFNVLYYYKSLKYIENDIKDVEMANYGFFITKISIIGTISNNIDKILVGIFLSPSALAIYAVGILFTNQIQSLSKGLLWIVSVKAIKQKILTKKTYLQMFALGVAITIICLLSFKFIIPFLFSNKYSDAIFLSEISILFFPFFIVHLLYSNKTTFENKKEILLKESLMSPLARILLVFIILPFFGIKGLAFLAGFQYVIHLAFLYALNRQKG